ncbi:hypothetical protein [Maribacter sp.]
MIRFLHFIDKFLGLGFERIKSATSLPDRQLALYRIFFGAVLLVYFSPTWSWLVDTPPAFFDPFLFSFANLTDNHLPNYLYRSADVLAVVLLLMITLGIRARMAFFGLFLLHAVFLSFYYSFGKIDHHTTLLVFTYLIFGFTNSGTKLAWIKDRKIATGTQNSAIAILALCICFGFFSAGLPKLTRWIDFDLNSSGFLFWYYPAYFLEKNQMFLAPYVNQIPRFVLECMDYMAAIFEISGFIFLLKGKKTWLFFLTIACIFHLANLLLLNIDFTMNLLAYGIYLIAPGLYFFVKKHKIVLLRTKLIFIVLFVALALLKILFQTSTISGVFFNYESIDITIKNYVNLFIWIAAIYCGWFALKKSEAFKAST